VSITEVFEAGSFSKKRKVIEIGREDPGGPVSLVGGRNQKHDGAKRYKRRRGSIRGRPDVNGCTKDDTTTRSW